VKLARASIFYRVLRKAGRFAVSLVFLGSVGSQLSLGRWLLFGGVAVILLATVAYELAYYRRFRYAFTEDTFDVSWGVFNRRDREIPYDRMQNVDISRTILQRVLGLSAVSIETAGGGSTEASITYVTADAATAIQSEIRHRKRAASDDHRENRTDHHENREHSDDQTAPEADLSSPHEDAETDQQSRARDDELLFEIAPSELALAGILSFDPRVPGLLFALFTGAVPFISPVVPQTDSVAVLLFFGAVGLAGLVVISWLVGAASAVVNYWGFRLTRSPTELRYERGLLQRYSGTIPFDKIQTVTITDNPLKRQAGYATLAVETAGYAPGQANERGSEAAVPIASRERVEQLAAEIDGCETVTVDQPPKRVRRRYLARYLLALGALTGILYAGAWWVGVAVPWYLPAAGAVLTPVAAHYKWRHRGYRLGEDHFLTRNGVWTRELKRVPYHRIQTVIDERTIFQRRWRLATVTADTAGSLSLLGDDAAAVDIDVEAAADLRTELKSRLIDSLVTSRSQRDPSGPTTDTAVATETADADDPVETDDATGSTDAGDAG